MVDKYKKVNASGLDAEQAFTVVSAGGANAGQGVGLDGTGKLDLTVMPVGIGPDTSSLPATEIIAANALVNVWSNAGVASIRNADASAASAGKPAHGFVLAGVAIAANGLVYFSGEVSGLTGLTPGAPLFLSDTTPGQASATVVTTTGHLLQPVGEAINATTMQFNPQPGVIRG